MSVETAIIAGMGFNTPPHPKSLEINLQNITSNIFHTTANQLMTRMPSMPPIPPLYVHIYSY